MEIMETMIIWSMEGMMNSPLMMKCRTWAHTLPLLWQLNIPRAFLLLSWLLKIQSAFLLQL